MDKENVSKENSQLAGQDELSKSLVALNINLINNKKIPLEVNFSDTLVEIKQYLLDSTELTLFNNFHFEMQNQLINEYVDIKTLEIESGAEIYVKLDPYDEKSAKIHIKKVQELLRNPSMISTLLGNYNPSQDLKANQKKTEKDNEDQKNEVSTKEGSKENIDLTMNDIIRPSLNSVFFQQKKKQNQEKDQPIFVHFINFSGFNPPPNVRKLKGDLLYLYIRTLEGQDFHVTANPQGFFLNNSNIKYFDPNPQNNAQVYMNLIDLLKRVSPLFKKKFETQLSKEPFVNFQDLPQLNFFKYGKNWLNFQDSSKLSKYEWDLTRCEDSLMNLYGLDPTGIRDWNEELNICRDLPKQEFLQRINRDKALIKIHNDFLEASIEGAKAVVEKNIQSLNPMDIITQQVFVYNHIFFSFALETPDSFKQEIGPEASPTISTANCDLRNLRILHKLDVEGLHVLNTALIDYRGFRVIAQSIIPGILNSDHQNCTEYGSIDDGKTISNNKEFHEIAKQIAQQFSLDDSVIFVDENGQEIELAGSLEVKGIKGSDRRKYFLDLMRLSPRDYNYKSDDERFLCCVLRHELIENFIMLKSYEQASEQFKKDKEIEEEQLKQKEGQKKEENQEKATLEAEKGQEKQLEASAQDQKEMQIQREKENLEKLMKFQDYIYQQKKDNQKRFKLNPNLLTKAPLANCEKLLQQETDLKELSEHLTKQVIPNFITELVQGDGSKLADSFSLQEIMHQFGINTRYLGKIAKEIDPNENPQLIFIFERIIFVRSLKHVFRSFMRDSHPMFLSQILSHLLNCVFSPSEQRQLLNEKSIQFENAFEQQQDSEDNRIQEQNAEQYQNKSKNKKKKKKSKNTNNVQDSTGESADLKKQNPQIVIGNPEVLLITPEEIWEMVRDIANNRYNYNLPQKQEEFKVFKLNYSKLAALRNICLSVGIFLDCKDYNIFEGQKQQKENAQQSNSSYKDLPFKISDIIDVTPIVKHIEFSCDDIKPHYDIAQKLQIDGKINEALECYQTVCQIILNLYGPIHKDIAFCYTKIAAIHYKLGEITQAIFYQKQAYKTYESFYGLDHYQTANALSNLGLYHFGIKNYENAIKFMLKSLYLFNIIGGEAYPVTFINLMNMALIYQESEHHQASLSCLFEALDRNKIIFGENHFKVAGCYQAIALTHFDIDDIKKAIEFQEKCVYILEKHLKSDDLRVKEAQIYLGNFTKALQEKKNQTKNLKNTMEESKRAFGSNKVQKKTRENESQQNQKNQNDREILLQKVKLAKMNAKYGYRRPNNIDMNRILMNQQYQQMIQQETQQKMAQNILNSQDKANGQ